MAEKPTLTRQELIEAAKANLRAARERLRVIQEEARRKRGLVRPPTPGKRKDDN